MDRYHWLLLVALAFMAGWALSDSLQDSVEVTPQAQASTIFDLTGEYAPDRSFSLMTTSADGRTVVAWAFRPNPGAVGQLPELVNTEVYEAEPGGATLRVD